MTAAEEELRIGVGDMMSPTPKAVAVVYSPTLNAQNGFRMGHPLLCYFPLPGFRPKGGIARTASPYFFSSTSTYSASMTSPSFLASPPAAPPLPPSEGPPGATPGPPCACGALAL